MDEELTPQEKLLAIDIKDRDKPNLMAVAAGIGAAFLLYRGYMRSRLKKSARIEEPTRHRLVELNARLFEHYRAVFIATLVPSLVAGYVHGLREVHTRRRDRAWMEQVATTYATGLVDVIHETSSRALVDGFTTQLNRKVPARMAIDRVIDAFGVTPRTMKALVNIWLGPAPTPSPTAIPLHNRIGERADRLVERAINERVERLGQSEAYTARNQAKAILWLYEKDQHPGAKVVWYTSNDERVCPICGPMHGKTRRLDQRFNIKGFGKAWAPPLHPSCRCDILLAEKVDGVRLTLEQESVLEDIRKDFDEREHPRARDGRFTVKAVQEPVRLHTRPKRLHKNPVKERQKQRQQQELITPEQLFAVAQTPVDMFSVTEATPQTEMALPETMTVSDTMAIPDSMALPETMAVRDTMAVPKTELSMPAKQDKAPKPPGKKWRRLPTNSPMFVLIPPDIDEHTQEIPDDDLYFFVSDDRSGTHPAEDALQTYWENRVFSNLEVMKSKHEDTEVVPGGLKIHAMGFELSPDLAGAPRGRTLHTILISDKEYAKLWDSAIQGVPYDRAGTVEVMLLDSDDREVQTRPMEVGYLRSWLQIDAMTDQLRPKIGISNYITTSEPISSAHTREVRFWDNTFWMLQNRRDRGVVPAVRGRHFNEGKWGQSHRGVYSVIPDDLDVD